MREFKKKRLQMLPTFEARDNNSFDRIITDSHS